MAKPIRALVVGGGGAAAAIGASNIITGAGGAGGFKDETVNIDSGSHTVTVGAAGQNGGNSVPPGGNGGTSSIGSLISVLGGGGGGSSGTMGGQNGGSGGGGAVNSNSGTQGGSGTGTAGQGNNGAAGSVYNYSGAGGGASAVASTKNGGNGTASDISGTSVTYAGGGAGYGGGSGTPGTGGGGAAGTNGTTNTGGGGGAAYFNGSFFGGGAGGSGIVIIRYPTASVVSATGGTITSDGADTIHTFLTSGTFTVTIAPTVQTNDVTNIGFTTADVNCVVSSDNGAVITERGVVYSTSPTPTISGSKTIVAGTTGSFTANVTGLTNGTHYYTRAYATNADGTAYGDEIEFDTTDTSPDSIYKDIGGVEGQTYAVRFTVGGTTGTVTVKLGTTGFSQVVNAGAGVTTIEGEYGGLLGLHFTASATFDGYIDDVMWVLILGDATVNWSLDTLINVFPINSEVIFRRIDNQNFNKYSVYRYLDVSFKDLNAYVTVVLKKEGNETLSQVSKEFLVSNITDEVLPFVNKKISTLLKAQAVRVGFSNNNLSEDFTICQFILSGMEQPTDMFGNSKIISVN